MINSSTDLSHHRTYGSRIRRFNNLSISNARTEGLSLLAPTVRAFCLATPNEEFHFVNYANTLSGLQPFSENYHGQFLISSTICSV